VEPAQRLFTPRFFLMCGFSFTVFLSAFQLLPVAPGQHAAGADVSVHEIHAPVRNQELADLVRVRHAARFEHVEHAIAFAVAFEVLQ
jgi:hypothetical protein